MLSQNKVDDLLKYILAVAGEESGWSRKLGMIHLIKYVYLADLAYSKYHHGQTYTGLKWIFHHYGPWSVDCYSRIEPALAAIHASRELIENRQGDDFIRWSIDDPSLFDALNARMDLVVAGTIQKYVRKFGNDTYGLLDFVYKTEPMLNAAPEEPLIFSAPEADDSPGMVDSVGSVTVRQKKKQQAMMMAFKEQLNHRLDERLKSKRFSLCSLPPRYDDVFFDGVGQLDQEAEALQVEGCHIAEFKDNIWKSKFRHDPEIS